MKKTMALMAVILACMAVTAQPKNIPEPGKKVNKITIL